MRTTIERVREAVGSLGDVPTQLAALESMSVNQLKERYRELYGEPTHTRNRIYLRKRLAWRIQELAEGGLTPSTLSKIAELGDELPESWRRRQVEPPPPAAAPTTTAVSTPATPTKARDPRLPPVGSVVTRLFNDTTHEVTITGDGFRFGGESFKTLSAIARQITGTQWNGFTFFGLTSPIPAASEVAS
jgi:hypothetical protein